MRILVLGGEGMLGHKMFQRLRDEYQDTMCTVRGRLDENPLDRIYLFDDGNTVAGVDVLDGNRLRAVLDVHKPDVVVNCVGVIKQRPIASDWEVSIRVNSLLPHMLAGHIARWGGRLIHFSTDCVFSGSKGNYREEEPSDARDVYGKTKYLGETDETNALTLRTSIIGRELKHFASLLEWFLSNRGGRIRGFTRAIYSGVTTNHLADVVTEAIARHGGLSGVYHVASTPIDKYALLCKLRDAYELNVEIEPDDSVAIDRSLCGERFVNDTGITCPDWDSLVAQLADDPTPYEKWRTR